jgi:opacity protein-like surface antigen
MKKIRTISLVWALLLISRLVSAQAFDDGTNLVSLGFGLPATNKFVDEFGAFSTDAEFYNYKLKNYGTGVLKYEHGLHKYFGLGLNLEYSAASSHYERENNPKIHDTIVTDVKSKIFGMYVRMNAHFPVGDKFDLYAGAGLGYLYTLNTYSNQIKKDAVTEPQPDKRKSVFDFDYQLTIGARYMIKEKLGVFLEVGKATTIAQLGLVAKF